MSLLDDLSADLADILGGEIGTIAAVTPSYGVGVWNLPGILRSPYRPERIGGQEVAGQEYRFLCRTQDTLTGGLKRGDTLLIEGQRFEHIDPQDGNPTAGMSTLQLVKL